MSPLPRVLLLSSESPHTGAAGAIVLQRLFAGWPADRLLVVTSNPPPATAGRLACRYEHLPLLMDRLNRTRFWTWRTGLRALGGTGFLPMQRVDTALAGFQPDVVVTLMQDSWYYDCAARYARRRRLPLVIFVHDLPDGFEPVAPWLKERQRELDALVYRQASRRLCISEPMRDHFKAVFGADGDVLLPPRADQPVTQSPAACADLKHPDRLTLGYAGGLHYGYGEQLLQMLPVLRATSTVIKLHCAPPGGKLAGLAAATDVLHFLGRAPTPEAAWHGLLTECDAVLQPYLNPPGEHARQYRTHFPSKLGECLSLGLPLLITGPADASGMAWCLQHRDCALTVSDPAPEALAAALHRLRHDGALRVALSARARSVADSFAPGALRERLSQIILDTVIHRA